MNHRSKAIAKLQRYLLRRGLPRFQMTVILGVTGLVGFGVSVALLALGVSSMPLRYLMAVLAGYVVFLLLVRLWAEYLRRRIEADADAIDIIPDFIVDAGRKGASDLPIGGGGGFGGGGASRGWEGPSLSSTASKANPILDATGPPSSLTHSGSSEAGSALDVDLDDGWVLIVPVVFLLGGLVVAAYVIYTAPLFLAEVFLDVALVSGLYRTLRTLEPRSWASTAIRNTWVPVGAIAVLVVVAGFIMQTVVPEADSLGDVIRKLTNG